jgi:hypothetical protein
LQVGQVESIKKSLEADLQAARESATTAEETLATEKANFDAKIGALRSENELLKVKAQALQEVQEETVVLLNRSNADTFFASQVFPLPSISFFHLLYLVVLWYSEEQYLTWRVRPCLQVRPLKAVLFTTKTEIPPLWRQLYEAQSMTTA